jgi:imidazoleglycerol-phosphate dehydratase
VRRAVIDRRTAETRIRFALNLDGTGRFDNRTGIRFLDHMLDLVARHGGFDLTVKATGDLDVDQHHTVEDVGIAFGEALAKAIDLGGRPHAVVETKVKVRLVGDLQAELVHDFFEGFATGARANVHVKVLYGRSNHHKIEACFKAFGRALRVASAKDRRLAKMLPSTKGLL